MSSLRNINLNLLPILRSLLRTASVSRSAAALHLSQPTISDALSRLRIILKDDLLIRIGGTMRLTQRATELVEPLEAICSDLELLLQNDDFDPAEEVRDIVVATSDICAYLLAPRIADFMRAKAPGMTLHIVDYDSNMRAKMAAREVAFALLPEFAVDNLSPAPLRFRKLATARNVMVLWEDHPLARQETISSEEVGRYPIIAFHPDAVIIEEKHFTPGWRILNLEFTIEMRTGQSMIIPRLLVGSNSVAFMNDVIARDMAKAYPIVVRQQPYREDPVNIGLVWSPVFDGDPVHRWLRESLAALPEPLVTPDP